MAAAKRAVPSRSERPSRGECAARPEPVRDHDRRRGRHTGGVLAQGDAPRDVTEAVQAEGEERTAKDAGPSPRVNADSGHSGDVGAHQRYPEVHVLLREAIPPHIVRDRNPIRHPGPRPRARSRAS